jgi:hypothetical protein
MGLGPLARQGSWQDCVVEKIVYLMAAENKKKVRKGLGPQIRLQELVLMT